MSKLRFLSMNRSSRTEIPPPFGEPSPPAFAMPPPPPDTSNTTLRKSGRGIGIMKVFGGSTKRIGPDPGGISPAIALHEKILAKEQKRQMQQNQQMYGTYHAPDSMRENQGVSSANTTNAGHLNDPALESSRKSALTGMMKVFRVGGGSRRGEADANRAVVLQEEIIATGQHVDNYNTQGTGMPHSYSNEGIMPAATFPSNDPPLETSQKSKFPGVMRVFRRNNSKQICPDPNAQHIPCKAIAIHEEILAKEQQALSNAPTFPSDLPHSFSNQEIPPATTFPSNDPQLEPSQKSKFPGVMRVFRRNNSKQICPDPNAQHIPSRAIAIHEEIIAKEQQALSTATTFPSHDSLSDSSRASKLSGVMNAFRRNSGETNKPSNPAVALQEEIHAQSQQMTDENRKLGMIAVARRDAEYRSRVAQETWLVNKTETSRSTQEVIDAKEEEEIFKMWMSQPIIEKELAARKQAVSMMNDEELYKPVVSTTTSSFA